MGNLKFLNSECPICSNSNESIPHLLYHCPQSQEHVQLFLRALDSATEHCWDFSEAEWFVGLTSVPYINTLILLAKWSIWLQRCNTVHGNTRSAFWLTFMFEVERLQATYNSIPVKILEKFRQFAK